MEIKIGYDVVDEIENASVEDTPELEKKKWVALRDLNILLNEWNCHNNPDIEKTINTLKMRIKV